MRLGSVRINWMDLLVFGASDFLAPRYTDPMGIDPDLVAAEDRPRSWHHTIMRPMPAGHRVLMTCFIAKVLASAGLCCSSQETNDSGGQCKFATLLISASPSSQATRTVATFLGVSGRAICLKVRASTGKGRSTEQRQKWRSRNRLSAAATGEASAANGL